MRWWQRTITWKPWYSRRRREEDLARELRAHIDLAAEERQEAGIPPDEARQAARRAFGNTTLVKEDTRATWGWTALEGLVRDLRYALRLLGRNPGFTVVAVCCLALGIGANTAVFSLVNAVLLKSLPVENPEQLVLMRYANSKRIPKEIRRTSSGYGRTSLSYATFEQLRDHGQTLSDVFAFVSAGFNNQSLTVNIGGEPTVAAGEMVSGGYFSGLGVRPILGRVITEDDEKPDAPPVAVISHAFWSGRFTRDPAVIGASINLNRMLFTIVGVAPPEFFGINPALAPDIWVPLRNDLSVTPWGIQVPKDMSMFADNTWWWVMIVGRLRPGAIEERSRAELNIVFQRSITEGLTAPPLPEDLPRLELVPASGGLNLLRQRFSEPLRVLMVAVGLVLLIACANVAILLLARAATRQKEMSVRLATGAPRAALIRQLLTESLVLAVIGGGLGLLFAHWGSRALLLLMSRAGQPIGLDVRPDATVLAFSAAVCILVGTLFGLAPAFQATRVDLSRGLKENASAGSPRFSLGKVLVSAQVALSLLLLTGAGLFLRTLDNLVSQEIGFDHHNLLLFALDARGGGNNEDRIAATYQRVLENIEGLPSVRSATASRLPLLSGWNSTTSISTDGPPLESAQANMVYRNEVGPAFFETMGISLMLGREIDWRDIQSRRKVVVVNQSMARHFFRDKSPLGHQVRLGTSHQANEVYEIIGVVGDAKYDRLREEPPPTVYFPYTSSLGTLGRLFFEVRTAGDPAAVVPAVREVVKRIDPELPLIDVKTQTGQIEESLTRERMFARLTSCFGALSLLLVTVGLYGTLAYAVTRRRHEIGIRMALGAPQRSVVWMVVRECVVMVAGGILIGLPLSFWVSQLVASQLFGVSPGDPMTLAIATLVLTATAVVAGYLPARRAARVDPLVALRYE